jgi:hypothetical protein
MHLYFKIIFKTLVSISIMSMSDIINFSSTLIKSKYLSKQEWLPRAAAAPAKIMMGRQLSLSLSLSGNWKFLRCSAKSKQASERECIRRAREAVSIK